MTYYQQIQQEMEDQVCKFCNKRITQQDQIDNNMTMLQTTDCFHQVHVDCLREKAFQIKSENGNVTCPRCSVPVADYELNQYLDDKQKADIEKNQAMQIVKINESFVCCSCGNIMEIVPGDVIKGQKDEKG